MYEKKIGNIIIKSLVMLSLASFILAAVVGYFVQNYFQHRQSFTLLWEYMEDFEREADLEAYIRDFYGYFFNEEEFEDFGIEVYKDNERLRRIVETNTGMFSEISLVDKSGIVINSSDPDMVGYDLRDSEYTKSYLTLLDNGGYLAKDIYPNPFLEDPSFKMAYVGEAFFDNSYILLMGFDEEAYNISVEDTFASHIQNVRIGLSGSLISLDTEGRIIAASENLNTGEETFSQKKLLPESDGELKESIADIYGKSCYVSALKRHDYYLVAVYPMDEADELRNKDNAVFVALFFVILTVLFIVIVILMRTHVLRDVWSIHTSLKRITTGELEERTVARGSLEFYELSAGINATVDNLKDRIKAAKEQMDREMENARRIQKSAVPTVFPENEAFDIFASMDTAEAVGGDFYDFFSIGEEKLLFVVADVAGKGMPAALYMMRAKTLIKTFAEQGLPIDEVARETNKKLCEDGASDMFVTAWLGILDLTSGVVSYVHAGHTFPVLIGDEVSFVRQKINMVLGGLKKAKYVRQEVKLKPGESIFLYTDGVTEAKSLTGDMYGEERLIELLHNGGDCRSICGMVYEDVCRFAEGAEQYDDITMLCIRYTGGGAA